MHQKKKYLVVDGPSEFELVMSLWDLTNGPRNVRFTCVPEGEEDGAEEVFEVHIMYLHRTTPTHWNYGGVILADHEEVTGLLIIDDRDEDSSTLVFR